MRRKFKVKVKTAVMVAALACTAVFVTEGVQCSTTEQVIDEFGGKSWNEMTDEEFTDAMFRMVIIGEENKPGTYSEGLISDIQGLQNGQPTGGTTGTPSEQPAKPATCDHDYESVTTKQPTCAEEGELVKTCTKCGDKVTETIPKTTYHKYTQEITKQPTCTADGEKTFTCGVCGDTYTETVPASGHHYEEKITTAATCTTDGVKTFKCRDCDDSYTEAIPATGHETDTGTVTKEAGWFTTGTKEYRCAACNEVLNTETIPSQYPIWVLYTIIGVVAVVIAVIAVIIIRKKKTSGSATGKAKTA